MQRGGCLQDRSAPILLSSYAMKLEPLNMLELDTPGISRSSRLLELLTRIYRAQFANYLRVFAGTGMRLGLQAVYFFVLANTLSLHDMGVFASTSSTGIMIGCFSGFGFASFAYRASAGKRRALGGYLAVFYVSWLVSLPLCLAASLPVFYLLFTTSLSLVAFTSIILVEVGTWRVVEMIHQVNNGLGRYTPASLVISLGTALRTAGALVFVASGHHDVETWSVIYLSFNVMAMALAVLVYQPRIKLRWRTPLFVGRIRDALMFSVAYCASISQNEIDKLVMLSLADQRTVGIYAISARIIDFTSVPIRSFYVLYSRKLIIEGRGRNQIGRSLGVEMMIALISTAAFAALLTVLSIWPDMLGHNVASATQLFAVLLAVPAFKNLLEYHSELFFVYQHMTIRAALATSLVALKAAALALLLVCFDGIAQWGIWLNGVYVGLYVLSAIAVYSLIFRREGR
jgi:O-antigen/teichoic acid export membrane protein